VTGLVARDLFGLRWLGSPRISPDGTRVAYIESALDEEADRTRHRVGLVAVASGRTRWIDGIPEPTDAAWSPDGSALALSTASGLWVGAADGGRARQVAPGSVSEATWSPDGGRLAYTSAPADDSAATAGPAGRIRVVGLAGSDPRLVGQAGAAWHPRWSPDGRSLAFLADDQPWRISADLSGSPARIRTPAAVTTAFEWSPDSSAVACLGRRDRDLIDVGQRLWVVDAASGSARELPCRGGASLGSPVRGDDPRGTAGPAICWSGRTGRIYLEASVHGRGPLVWLAPTSAESGTLLDGEHACLSPSLSRVGSLAVVICGPAGPGDIWVVGEDGGRAVRLTAADDEVAARAAPTAHTLVQRDGAAIDAWLTGSAAGGTAPLVVSVHGGPYYSVGWRFTFEVQRLAARGALVLTLNPRGSAGCGDDFATGIRGDWGGADAADITAAVDAVATRRDIDDARIAICGVSYGGFMAQWLLTQSGRYRTGISENGISDFRGMWQADPGRRAFWRLAMGGAPDTSDRYDQRSPLRSADRIRAPLLLVHAELDKTCPIAQSTWMLDALRLAGVGAELVTLPGEGHLINVTGRPSSRLLRARTVDHWLDRTLFAR
jgi:dipeptidyl aminopeptidase/acylaminoacyl peptidase